MLPPPEFLKIFNDRQQCFAELLELSQKQLGLVEADEYAQLLGLLGGKQQIIARLDTIGKTRPQLWDEWRLERDRLAPRIRRECEQALAETEALLSQLLESERVGTERLARRRDETARALRTVASGTRVNQAYRDSLAPVTHRHLDLDQ